MNERLENLLPLRIILGTPPGDNAPKGLVELSFAMDWQQERVLVLWSGKAFSILGEHQLDALEDANELHRTYSRKHKDWKIEIIDPLSEECPVDIDWDQWLKDRDRGYKFGSRNALFKMRGV